MVVNGLWFLIALAVAALMAGALALVAWIIRLAFN